MYGVGEVANGYVPGKNRRERERETSQKSTRNRVGKAREAVPAAGPAWRGAPPGWAGWPGRESETLLAGLAHSSLPPA